MRQAYRELAKISHTAQRTCFCIHEVSSKVFSEWRECEAVLSEDEDSTRTSDHIKCNLFLCEVARQGDRHPAAAKVSKKHDGGAVQRKAVKKREDEGTPYFCHLEHSGEHIGLYRRSKKMCSAIVEVCKLPESDSEGMTQFRESVDPLEQQNSSGASCQHPSVILRHHPSTIVYKGSAAGVYYTEPSYPPLYGVPPTAAHHPEGAEGASLTSPPSQLRDMSLSGDGWVPGNAVYQERNANDHLYHSVGYYHYGSISLPKPVLRLKTRRKSSSSAVKERIAVRNMRKRDGKPCAVIEFRSQKETAAAMEHAKAESMMTSSNKGVPYFDIEESRVVQRNYITTATPQGQLRSGKIKSSSVETDQEKLRDLMVTQSYTSTSKLDYTVPPSSRQHSAASSGKRSRACLLEKRDTVSSIPSKSSSLSRLPELQINTRHGLTSPDTHTDSPNENGHTVDEGEEMKDLVSSSGPPLVSHKPPLPLPVAKRRISERLHYASKQLTDCHSHLPKPFKSLTRARHPPFQPSPNRQRTLNEQDKNQRTAERSRNGHPTDHHFEDARCVLRSRERRAARLNRSKTNNHGGIHSQKERTSYRVKVCLRGSKVPLTDPPTKPVTIENDDYPVDELYAE